MTAGRPRFKSGSGIFYPCVAFGYSFDFTDCCFDVYLDYLPVD